MSVRTSPRPAGAPPPTPNPRLPLANATAPAPGATLEAQILHWYGQQIPKIEVGRRPVKLDLGTPPAPELAPPGPQGFVGMLRSGALPADPIERLALVRHMAETDHGSMAFGALLLRVTAEAGLAGPDIADRPADLSVALEETLGLIHREGTALRLRIFDEKLDPYLQRGRLHLRHRFEMSKAYRPPPAWLRLDRDTSEERWGTQGDEGTDITREYLARHPWGLHLGVLYRPREVYPSAAGPGGSEWRLFGAFDRLQVPNPTDPRRELANDGPVPTIEIRFAGATDSITVTLPPGATITWPDLLRAAWAQHRAVISARLDGASMDLAAPKDPLLLMAVMERMAGGDDAQPVDRAPLLGWLTDFWMF